MNEQQILETIEQIRPNIKKLAYVFVPKMKQPSIHTVKDLEQEGERIVIQNIRDGRPDETKGKISTYLIRSIITHFIDLMKASYKIDLNRDEEIVRTMTSKKSSGFEELNILLQVMEILNCREKEYLTAMLSPPEQVRERFSKNRKIVRRLVRELLNISQEEERSIRKELKRKLTGERI